MRTTRKKAPIIAEDGESRRPKWLPKQEFMRMHGVGRTMLDKLMEENKVKYTYVGKFCFISVESFDKFMENTCINSESWKDVQRREWKEAKGCYYEQRSPVQL